MQFCQVARSLSSHTILGKRIKKLGGSLGKICKYGTKININGLWQKMVPISNVNLFSILNKSISDATKRNCLFCRLETYTSRHLFYKCSRIQSIREVV
uniref:Uncharacterized protein n=1 Tax=Lepeophtheirus salmonis TaxID=72036 RepID=A0A0K2TNU1_LEPSM